MYISSREKQANHFWTGCTHWGHFNIIRYTQRPFKSLEGHDEALIENWNKEVGPNDVVHHAGDFCFWKPKPDVEGIAKLIHRLNGRIHFVWGNHDRPMMELRKNHHLVRTKIKWCGDIEDITLNNQRIITSHYPFVVWNASHHGSFNLHSHCHGTLPDDPHSRRIDIGVDPMGYKPVDFETVSAIMAKKLWKPIDHHKPKEETGGRGYSREEYARLERKAVYEALKQEFQNEESK